MALLCHETGFEAHPDARDALQARNICALAKYGNKGTVGKFPSKQSQGYTNWSVRGQVHWFGNCREGASNAHCCTGAAPFKTGQDWLKFSSGAKSGCMLAII